MAKPIYLFQGTDASTLSVGLLLGSKIYAQERTIKELGGGVIQKHEAKESLYQLGARRLTVQYAPQVTEVVEGEDELETIFPIVSLYLDKESEVSAPTFAKQLSEHKANVLVKLYGVVEESLSSSEKLREHTRVVANYLNGNQI